MSAPTSAPAPPPTAPPPAAPGRPAVLALVVGVTEVAGSEGHAVALAGRLDPARWKVVAVCPGEGGLAEAFRRAGVEVRLCPRPRMYSTSVRVTRTRRVPNPLACGWDAAMLPVAARRLAAVLRDVRPDLVLTKWMFTHLYGALAARKLGVPCVWHVEDTISERWGGLFRRLLGALAGRLPTAVIPNAETIAAQLPPALAGRVRVIRNAVDTDRFRPGGDGAPVRAEFGIPADAPVVGHFARMVPWKGQHHLLEAFGRLAAEFPTARLLLVGSALFERDTYLEQLRARAARMGLADRVVFTGYRSDVPRIAAALDVMAYPSVEKDTYPFSLLEAMACGVPAVVTDIPGIRLVVRTEAEALIVPPRDEGRLADAIRRLLADPPGRRELGMRGRRRIEEGFSLAPHVRQFEQALRAVIDAGRAGPAWPAAAAGAGAGA